MLTRCRVVNSYQNFGSLLSLRDERMSDIWDTGLEITIPGIINCDRGLGWAVERMLNDVYLLKGLSLFHRRVNEKFP